MTHFLDDILFAIDCGAFEFGARSEDLYRIGQYSPWLGSPFRLFSQESPYPLGFAYDLQTVIALAERMAEGCCSRGENQEPRVIAVPSGAADWVEVTDGYQCRICLREYPWPPALPRREGGTKSDH